MKRYFITGLVILLPLAVTIAVVVFIIDLLTKPFMGMMTQMLTHFTGPYGAFLRSDTVVRYTSQFLILILLFLCTVVLGMITRWFFVHALLKLGDRLLGRIPLVNTVYKTSQEIIRTLFSSTKSSFKQVVMVPFPHKETYMIGLVAGDSPKSCCDQMGEELISVLVPTTPNPTTGFLLMFKRRDLVYVDMKTEDAIKYVVSCGVVTPEHPLPLPPKTRL